MISREKKLAYLEEMIQSYEKKGMKRFFIEQFLQGAGNELSKKFWEQRSSSRMAYDLYSWMKEDENVIDFSFEFQLPHLNSGGIGPNMDVFIETEDELIFIESKFTEKANMHYIDNGYLKEAYYADKPYGRSKMGLIQRFYENHWAELFSKFCYEWEDIMNQNDWHKANDWFEPKQETCHLSGILLYLFDERNQRIIKNKHIRLYNIYWKMPGDNSTIEHTFCSKAQELVDRIINEYHPSIIDFKIDAFSVQEMLGENKLSKHIHFPKGMLNAITTRNEDILATLKMTSR